MKMQVWNDNTFPYAETFKGDKIAIPAKSFILMEEDDAIYFKGTYSAMRMKGDGTPDPAFFKMIRLVPDFSNGEVSKPAAVQTYICNACRYSASNETDLSEHSKTHAEIVVTDENAERETRVKQKAFAKTG